MLIRHEHDLAQLAGYVRGHGFPCPVIIGDEKRTAEQNDKMWPMLRDIALQVKWMVDGQLCFMSEQDWKAVFIASLKNEVRVAAGIDGGMVFLSASSKRLTKKNFSMLIEIIYAFGSRNHVAWSEPAMQAYERYREAQ